MQGDDSSERCGITCIVMMCFNHVQICSYHPLGQCIKGDTDGICFSNIVRLFFWSHSNMVYLTVTWQYFKCNVIIITHIYFFTFWNVKIFLHFLSIIYDDVIKWKHFQCNWPFVQGIHRSQVNSPHKGQWRRALMFSLICVWTNVWVKNQDAGDLRCHHTHYDIIVMQHWDGKGSWYLAFWKTTICLGYMFNTMVADDLVTWGTRASATMVSIIIKKADISLRVLK